MIAESESQNINQNKSSQKMLLAIVLVSVIPIVLAYFMFFTGWGVPQNTVNMGTLLPTPIHLNDLFDDATTREILQEPKWRLIIPIGHSCNQACEQNLYTTRQVHVRLGTKSDRVERLAVNIGGTVGQRILNKIAPEHPRLKPYDARPENWAHWIHSSGLKWELTTTPFYLLMDQEGNAMMAYTSKQHGNDLLKDLKRALKYSPDYE